MFESENDVRVGAATALVGVSILYFATRFALSAWAPDERSGPRRRAVAQWLPVPATLAAASASDIPIARKSSAWIRSVFAGLLTVFGAVAAAGGAIATSNHSRLFTTLLMSTSVISPLIMLPALGSATITAHRGQLGQ